MTARTMMRINAVLAAFVGLALRLFFVLRFPATDSGDAPFYIELAWNWLRKGVYGGVVNGQLTPLDTRAPGYPAFLAAVFSLVGNSSRAVMLAQTAVDLGTCFLIALIAARLAPEAPRRRAAIAGLWLAAFCPFTANYAAVVLTETLVTFLTALAIVLLLEAYLTPIPRVTSASAFAGRTISPWFLAGVIAGFGALVRPETPLLLLAVGLVLVAKWRRPADWLKLVRAGALMGAGLVLPLVPWAARNWHTLHEVQPLAPRYLQTPGEFTPLGFDAWTRTWLWRFGDVYLANWKLDYEEIPIDTLPARAFDSPDERARVANLLEPYNDTLTLSPEQDVAFREIARERTSRRPLRTYLEIPLLRSLAMWFTPRVELLPYTGHLFPLREKWQDDRRDFLVTLSFVLVNGVYIALALAGAWMARRRPGLALLIVFALVRTAFFAGFIETPEPRYVLECFPVVLALGAQVFCGGRQRSSTGSG
ncbi:MAG TPA: glycosyltransferase family 39 protein [Candidatus Acidoferrales bacterium]|nr:glycosyltransferase family 39 protein [Candidatus Acidoferrales bacterium]